MVYSDGETYSDAEIFSEPEDLFNDEAEEDGEEKKNVEKEDEEKKPAEEAKVKKPKRVVKNPRKTLNFDTLNGKNGLKALRNLFKDFQFKGDGHELEDLTRVMAIFQQWVNYYLFPGYEFESCLQQLEYLGRKKIVQTLLKKYRAGIDDWGEVKPDDDGGGGGGDGEVKEMEDLDVKLDEEIAKVRSDVEFSGDEAGGSGIQQNSQPEEVTLTQEQLERIARNRKLAEERRMKRMSQQCSQLSGQTDLSESVTTPDDSQI